MNYDAVIAELRRIAKSHEGLVNDPYKHQAIKQTSATVATILNALASAIEHGKGE